MTKAWLDLLVFESESSLIGELGISGSHPFLGSPFLNNGAVGKFCYHLAFGTYTLDIFGLTESRANLIHEVSQKAIPRLVNDLSFLRLADLTHHNDIVRIIHPLKSAHSETLWEYFRNSDGRFFHSRSIFSYDPRTYKQA